MKRYFRLYCFLLAMVMPAVANAYILYGRVIHSLTRRALEGVKATLMRTDSTLVDDVWITDKGRPEDDAECPWKFAVPVEEADYILRLELEGFETTYRNLHVKAKEKEDRINMGDTRIRPARKRDISLKEVTTRATLVKFYTKKDTIIYNADAFQLAEGSMLDALIKQLPGVELKDDGRILVNGRYVQSLLLNGDDFFASDRSIMLENLPAYMVKNVKVYEKASKKNEFFGKEIDKPQLVMDVHLKRQYSIGWMANAEAGKGTEDRYLGRTFGLRFTPQSRLSFFGNLNNVNESRKPGANGDWSPSNMPVRLNATKTAGLDYQVKDVDNHFLIKGDAKAEHLDTDQNDYQIGTNYLPQGNTYLRGLNRQDGCNTSFNTHHNFEYKQKRIFISATPSISYRKWTQRGLNASTTLAEDPAEYIGTGLMDSLMSPVAGTLLRHLALNRTQSAYSDKGDEWNTSLKLTSMHKMSLINFYGLYLRAFINYRNRTDDNFSHYRLEYPNAPEATTDYRNQWIKGRPNWDLNYKVEAEIVSNGFKAIKKTYFWTQLSYSFEQKQSKRNHALYRLDRLDGWGEESDYPLGALPSEVEQLQQSLDRRNSYNSYHIEDIHRPELLICYEMPDLKGGNRQYISLTLPLKYTDKHLDYQRANIDTAFSRNAVFIEPQLFYTRDIRQGAGNIQARYSLSSYTPQLTNLVDYRDDSDPLNIKLGNTRLKNLHTHNISLAYRNALSDKQRFFNVNLNYSITQNAIAWGYTYDRETGVKTSKPDNINGNYSLTGGIEYSMPLDKAKRLNMNTSTNAQFYNNVDLIHVKDAEASARSVVQTLFLGETLKLDYRINKYKFGTKLSGTWAHAASHRQDFETVNAADFNYGVTAQLELPWNIQLYTDLTMYSRRGYEDHGMNTDDLVWNARLSKRMMRGKLALTLDGFDMLHNLSNVTRSLNGQGRTETYRNVIPSYAMLRLIYKINIKPKKLPGE